MAKISESAQLRYRNSLRSIQADAQAYVARRLETEARGLAVADARDKAIEILRDCDSVFGDRAQAIAAELFDEVCEAEGIKATSEVFDDVIDGNALEERVRYYAGYLAADEPDVVSFERMVSQLGGYYTRRSAYANTLLNCSKNEIRYARVPGGGETCRFCMMLAGRGFVYLSESKALGHGYHPHCDCVAIPGKKGTTAIEGYNPKACAELAKKFEEIESDRNLSPRQREALKAAWSMAKIGEDTAGLKSNPRLIAETLNDALVETEKAFKKEKTEDNYSATIRRFLNEVGKPFSVEMNGGTYVKKSGREIVGACPDGEELWAALRWAQEYGASSIRWIPETTAYKTPDLVADGIGYEIKTPKSMRKITRLAKDASEKRFDLCGASETSKNAIFSIVRVGDIEAGKVAASLDGFVRDGSLDSYAIVAT